MLQTNNDTLCNNEIKALLRKAWKAVKFPSSVY